MNKLELSIIIVDYKSLNFTLKLIASIEEFCKEINYEIIVVDNDPSADSAEKLKKKFTNKKNYKILKAKKNAGFGSGNNLGAKVAKGEYLLLLNPDTEIVDDSIEKMLDFLSKHAEIGALSPILYQKDASTIQRHSFGKFQTLLLVIFRRQAGSSFPRSRESTNSFFYSEMITAAALMIKKDLFNKIGGFDEKYFMYFEDEDLCREISKLGYKNAVLITAKIIHHEGQSSTSKEKKQFYYKSQDYYWQKWNGPVLTILMKTLRTPYLFFQKFN
ncbi:MAG: glycosyltransferase [Candidatus Berkelbacteria bacterium Athens1014_28]|uniref:Glycosyltransferase n=1 Tax=Candidatus Berkelbacteria bacterium Athens1014_28 TaxID=2017145 RepID=A0A554LMK5_9BACT|nr:MAG: glycosyltransferase [Candidatus Berkelbacteria bacterium Athens1014_28]